MSNGRTNSSSYLRQLVTALISVAGIWLLLSVMFDLRAGAWIYTPHGFSDSTIILSGKAAPADEDSDEPGMDTSDVAPTDIDKYIRVYRAMQHDRNLTVDQAVQKEGWTVDEFRAVEVKIERDDLVRDHVRQELQKSAEKPGAKTTKTKHKI